MVSLGGKELIGSVRSYRQNMPKNLSTNKFDIRNASNQPVVLVAFCISYRRTGINLLLAKAFFQYVIKIIVKFVTSMYALRKPYTNAVITHTQNT